MIGEKCRLKASITKEDPILFYYWTPEWAHAEYEISPVGESIWTEGCEVVDLDKEDWLETSTSGCARQDAKIYVAYSKSLQERNPPVAKFLSQITLDPDVVNQWILQIGRDKMDPRDVAEQWVEENMDTVNSWIQ